MPGPERTQVAIVGAGPAGLLLGHLLARAGIEAVVLEQRDRAYVEARQRAGVLEQDVADLLRAVGLGDRMDREAMPHDGLLLQFAGERHRLDLRALTGRGLVMWAQTEIVRDLVAARLDGGLPLRFGVRDVALHDLDGDRPRVTWTDPDGAPRTLEADVVAGCDGAHGPSRAAVAGAMTVRERRWPHAWLGVLAAVAPSSPELLYAHHEEGFALLSARTPQVSRLYLQVPVGTDVADWPDDRVWAELSRRTALPGWALDAGPVRDRSLTPLRAWIGSPVRHGRLFLAGDAAHVVPPTGAKGLNLAAADAVALAGALVSWLLKGDDEPALRYAADAEARAWQVLRFSTAFTALTHADAARDPFEHDLRLAALRRIVTSEASATAFAEAYAGAPLPELP